ncbi:hypothetical protein RBI14_11850 [Alcaligenaceae bacterium B3P038]|nr:hypothetical protein [Alcaligenaceae bacterium B3P038]
MTLSTNNTRATLEPHDDVFDGDFGLGGPGEGVEFDDADDEHRSASVTITHGVTYLPLISLSAYRHIACVQAGAAYGRRVVLWSADDLDRAVGGSTQASSLLIEVVNLHDTVTLGSVADQLRALLGPERARGISDPRRALRGGSRDAEDPSLAEL